MKNEFSIPILWLFLCLTSCITDADSSLTGDSGTVPGATVDWIDSVLSALPAPDSSKFYFFVENPAGTTAFQHFDFRSGQWDSSRYLIERPFTGGPLSAGRMIHHHKIWRDSTHFFLYGKQLERGMVLEVNPLAFIEINNDPLKSTYIVIPSNPEFRLASCETFDEWFTVCNDHRFFVQYWLEHQFAPRSIHRIQWKPFNSFSSVPALPSEQAEPF